MEERRADSAEDLQSEVQKHTWEIRQGWRLARAGVPNPQGTLGSADQDQDPDLRALGAQVNQGSGCYEELGSRLAH